MLTGFWRCFQEICCAGTPWISLSLNMAHLAINFSVHDSVTVLANPIDFCVFGVVAHANGMSNFMSKELIFTQNEKKKRIATGFSKFGKKLAP